MIKKLFRVHVLTCGLAAILGFRDCGTDKARLDQTDMEGALELQNQILHMAVPASGSKTQYMSSMQRSPNFSKSPNVSIAQEDSTQIQSSQHQVHRSRVLQLGPQVTEQGNQEPLPLVWMDSTKPIADEHMLDNSQQFEVEDLKRALQPAFEFHFVKLKNKNNYDIWLVLVKFHVDSFKKLCLRNDNDEPINEKAALVFFGDKKQVEKNKRKNKFNKTIGYHHAKLNMFTKQTGQDEEISPQTSTLQKVKNTFPSFSWNKNQQEELQVQNPGEKRFKFKIDGGKLATMEYLPIGELLLSKLCVLGQDAQERGRGFYIALPKGVDKIIIGCTTDPGLGDNAVKVLTRASINDLPVETLTKKEIAHSKVSELQDV